ncbi:MAG: hypothetical protein D6780_04220 [Candidatus Dadabacteria bacterium]|nr:MAG: hypothetical protein D6780_04220 [Candidatus Dadabacteria bacterium]
MDYLRVPIEIFNNLGVIWTFILLLIRYTAFFMFIPGIGMGFRGVIIRFSAILVFAIATTVGIDKAVVPSSLAQMALAGFSEFILGAVVGIVPQLIIAGVQTAGSVAGATMGLGAAQLIDPTLGVSVPTLSRILGDIVVLIFLLMGGHYLLIYAVSGIGSEIVPGTFILGADGVEALIEQAGLIFNIAIMVSAPIVVAILLTQFVMGLLTKAVPTLNIFIVSFPLTIGLGLFLAAVSVPEVVVYIQKQLSSIEGVLVAILSAR